MKFSSVAIAAVVLSTLRDRTDVKETRMEWELCMQFCLPLKYMGKTNGVHRNHNLISAEETQGWPLELIIVNENNSKRKTTVSFCIILSIAIDFKIYKHNFCTLQEFCTDHTKAFP